MILHVIRAKNVVARRVCEGMGLARERETTRADPSLRIAEEQKSATLLSGGQVVSLWVDYSE